MKVCTNALLHKLFQLLKEVMILGIFYTVPLMSTEHYLNTTAYPVIISHLNPKENN